MAYRKDIERRFTGDTCPVCGAPIPADSTEAPCQHVVRNRRELRWLLTPQWRGPHRRPAKSRAVRLQATVVSGRGAAINCAEAV